MKKKTGHRPKKRKPYVGVNVVNTKMTGITWMRFDFYKILNTVVVVISHSCVLSRLGFVTFENENTRAECVANDICIRKKDGGRLVTATGSFFWTFYENA